MKKIRLWIISFSFIFLLFTTKTPAFAAIVINEFSSNTAGTTADPDWVEIYNNGASPIDLSEYRLEDLNATNKKTLSGIIEPSGFATFDWINRLDKAGDVISLIKISDSFLTDRVSYGDQGGDAAAPEKGQSAGRQTDGGNKWVIFSAPTKKSTNNTSSPAPTSTPAPTNIPTPTKTPTPPKTPTSAPIKSGPTATPASKPTVTSSFSPAQKLAGESGEALLVESLTSSSSTPTATNKHSSSPSPTSSNKVLGASQNNLSKILIGLGIILLAACGILAFRSFKKKSESS